MSLYPLLLQPTLHTRVWGGRRLQSIFSKTLPTNEPYGESWELHDSAAILNGALAGRILGDLVAEYGAALIGEGNNPAEGFPLLAKLLDASDWLSVQVHPNDEQARELEGDPRGKTEAWYILAAEPDAQLVIGIQPGSSREDVAAAIRDNTLENLAAYAHVEAGDLLYIPAGTVHAIGPGTLIYEIQQSSDVTYRLYDWGRMGLDGKPRTLHIEKGVSVSNLDHLPEIKHTGGNTMPVVDIVRSPYFVTLLHQLSPRNGPRITLDTEGRRFHALTCIEGMVEVSAGDTTITLGLGQTALIPAGVGAYQLAGTARVLRSFQPL